MENAGSRTQIYLAWFSFHLILVLCVCVRDTSSLIADGYTSLPASLQTYGEKIEYVAQGILAESLPARNPWRQMECIYQNLAGIELGYAFFAPAVPNSFKLVFEIHYPDGRIEYDLPHVREDAAGSRLTRVLDEIGRLEYEPLREMIIKMLAYHAWQAHPGATKIRAIFGFIQVPSPTEFRQGDKEKYRFMYAYDLSFDRP